MEKGLCGIVIKVENLTLCRSFYRDFLDLGDPVADSNFLCEFSCGNGFSLILEKAEWEFLPRERESRSFPVFPAEDLDAVADRLARYGYRPERIEENKFGTPALKCLDPEGNPFFVMEKAPAEQTKK